MYHNLLQNEANWTGRIYEYIQIEKGSFVGLRILIQYRTGSETMDRNLSAELISIYDKRQNLQGWTENHYFL